MPFQSQEFLQRCLLIDIEVNENNDIYSIGAVLGKRVYQTQLGKLVSKEQLLELDDFAAGAEFVLGHNILRHDLPRIELVVPSLNFLKKPAIDTLYLSPLAFPENPYHRLVKDYKIVRDSLNDPVGDAAMSGIIFSEQWAAFTGQIASNNDVPVLYRSFLQVSAELAGTAQALEAMGVPVFEDDDLYKAFFWFAGKHACTAALQKVVEQLADGTLDRPQIAYVCAWLSVSGGNSVLPPWVRHRYPDISNLLHQLREVPCGLSECAYCGQYQNPKYFLQRFFGFEDFRSIPSTTDGKSLQEEIVKAAARNASVFATLPTGGGKSLCYLLPALMRYQRCNMLTIVISPLQALMKDQVDNFSNKTGTGIAAAIYGLQTLPERGAVQEGIRLGDIGVLYVSPEQLRNKSFVKTISQRVIGAWVFDEAHCLSKWGHDFRPDYLYSIRFIREFALTEKSKIPPVQCFTATAKNDVRSEILDIVQSELGVRVLQFEGGHERTNLHYEVWSVSTHEKNQVILELLRARYQGTGSVVIYCASRKKTEQIADFLNQEGYESEAFHAGLEPTLKKRIQDNFIQGVTPIICATNAFGMGIDKDNVRLVIHADIPGSLENYLQEAGRAGRDREQAECILIFSDQDIEGQFRLSATSRLSQKEIAQLLRGIRSAAKGRESIVLTPGEILRLESVEIDSDTFYDPDTKVRTAIAWLEKAGYLARNENDTRVFQGRPLVPNLEEAKEKIAELGLSKRQQDRWLAIMSVLMERRPNQGFSADEIASLNAFGKRKDDPETETEAQLVIRTLNDMAEQGLLTKVTALSAYIRYKTQDSSEKRFYRLSLLESDFLKVLRQAEPDVETDTTLVIDLRQVNQRLLDLGHQYSTPQCLRLLLYGLSRDGKGLAGQKGSISVKASGGDVYSVLLHRDWESLAKTVQIRQQAAVGILAVIHKAAGVDARPNATLLVEFTLEDVIRGLKSDLVLLPLLKDPLAAAERGLTFMHEQSILDLQQGLTVFRQGMTLSLNKENRRRHYSKADFEPLQTHYSERNFQIHVMNEYARRALEKINVAMHLVSSYFKDDKADFIKRFFPGREKYLDLATSEQSYIHIVSDLQNAIQEAIVSSPIDSNILVLAGPGSGKTRVVAHRVAYLLRVKRVPARSILVLCFNRSAVLSLRRRIRDLVGDDMRRVTTLTFHGLALRLTGRTLVPGEQEKRTKEIDFSQIIKQANALLKGETDTLGFDESSPRDSLVGRLSHILVDEYQDIDDEQYELVSLLAGRTLQEEGDQKLSILAVGDDDQNIYQFRGANIEFIKRFREDYDATIHHMVENYRSTVNIIAASNQLIAVNVDRMKVGHAIKVNSARTNLPAGGNWQLGDPVGKGKVQLLRTKNLNAQAQAVLDEMNRIRGISDQFIYSNTAVLAREWQELDLIRVLFEKQDIPVNLNWGKGAFPSFTKIREYAIILEALRNSRSTQKAASSLLSFLPENADEDNLWQNHLRGLIIDWLEETNDRLQPVSQIEEYLYEALSDQHRSQNLGNGVFLSTMHSVKGLEFDHVFVLGGSYSEPRAVDMEEERRLLYVAMTRARETLQLFEIEEPCHPHTAVFSGTFIERRSLLPQFSELVQKCGYSLLGMTELYLGYAGGFNGNHQIHATLSRLKVGDTLKVAVREEQIYLVTGEGVSVARFSKAAKSFWKSKISLISKIKVLAMVRWGKADSTESEYADRCKVDSWEIPVCEVKYL